MRPLDGQPLAIPGTTQVIPAMRRLLDAYRHARLPIVHIVRIYRPDGSNVDVCRREAVEKGDAIFLPDSKGAELAPGLLPQSNPVLNAELLLGGGIQTIGERETVIYKPRWGAFYHTPLEDHLRSLNVNTLVFTGCYFPNCPRAVSSSW